MRLLIIACIMALLLGCSQEKKDIFQLYKISIVASPDSNSMVYNLSLNYVSDTIEDTVVFYLNRNMEIIKLYGRNLIIYHFDTLNHKGSYDNFDSTSLRILFDPPLNAFEYVRINADFKAGLDEIARIDTSANGFSYTMDKTTYWFPVETGQRPFFYAVNVRTDSATMVTSADRVHLIDGNWQMISENPANDILIQLIKNQE